ncbi:hypothetical protein BJ741DRAFT_622606 [Chytriomyces cf. hyalinus JEL632]|nr:hypothetical protein BJ741DRAFT_622606 [Chytriomyces cf. hyalinus JEL632]
MAPNTEFPLFPFSKFRPYVPFLENKTVTRRDPWARRDAWRNDGFFSIARRRAGLFPGLGLGTAAFAVYLAYDTW